MSSSFSSALDTMQLILSFGLSVKVTKHHKYFQVKLECKRKKSGNSHFLNKKAQLVGRKIKDMIRREDIIDYIVEKYTIYPEYKFEKFPNYCVFRQKRKKKWFGLIMTIPRNKLYGDEEINIDVINLKINTELNELLRNKNGYCQAYHMNKEHWITIDLSVVEDFDQIAGLIDDSFKLTC